jgi:hypothetical protein
MRIMVLHLKLKKSLAFFASAGLSDCSRYLVGFFVLKLNDELPFSRESVRSQHKQGHFEVIAGKSLLAFKRDQEEKQELSGRCFAWVQTYDEKPNSFDGQGSSGDPAEWNRTSYESDPIDSMEPLEVVPNEYRERALDCMALLKAVDECMARAQDPRLAWVGISTVLDLDSTRGRSLVELSRQMGCSEDALSNSKASFRKLSGLDPSSGRSVPWV